MKARARRILSRLLNLETQIDALRKYVEAIIRPRKPAITGRGHALSICDDVAVEELATRVAKLEASQRENEDIRALVADRISAGRRYHDLTEASNRAIVNSAARIKSKRERA